MNILILIFLGALAGLLSGLLGIGGAIVIIPGLVFFLGFTQKMAQGTTLLMLLPPIGILAVLAYYRQGQVDIRAAIILCIAFVFASWLGAQAVQHIPQDILRRLFGVFLLCLALYYIFKP